MSDRYIPGVPCWADITPPDAEAAVEFYGGLFGWEFENVAPPGAPTPYYIARLRGEDVGAIGSDPAGAAAWNTYIWVEDADETVAKVRAAGGSVVSEPMDVGPAGRSAVIAGSTVIISMLGLFLMRLPYLYGVALFASLAVLVVLAASVTLLPGLNG